MTGNLSMSKGSGGSYVLTDDDKQEIADKVGNPTFYFNIGGGGDYSLYVESITESHSNRTFTIGTENLEARQFFDYLTGIGTENAIFKVGDCTLNYSTFDGSCIHLAGCHIYPYFSGLDNMSIDCVTCNQYTIYFNDVELGEHWVYTSTSTIPLYPYNEPCIMEGTPINMADGSEKLIEEVQAGDIVLSYDPATETNVSAVVIDCYITGHNRGFDTYHFSDGRWLTLYDLHQIYSKGIGSVKDVRKITRNDQIVNMDGEIIRWTGTSKIYYQGEKKRRYNIITSNNLYYANGILLGHKPFSKLHRVLDSHGKVTASEEIRAVWQKDCDIYNQHNEFLNTKEFNAELAECNRQYASSKHIIEVNKQRLVNSDYKVQKRAEGLIDDNEWDESKKKRAGWRNEINEHEVLLKKAEEARRAVIKKYRGDITERSMFEECCVRDNALFDACKEYFAKGRGDK